MFLNFPIRIYIERKRGGIEYLQTRLMLCFNNCYTNKHLYSYEVIDENQFMAEYISMRWMDTNLYHFLCFNKVAVMLH